MAPRRAGGRELLVATALLLASLLAHTAPAAAQDPSSAATLPADIDALTQFKAGITNAASTVLLSWVPGTDPCQAGWVGVACACAQVPPMVMGCPASDPSGMARVLALSLGPAYRVGGQKLQGVIAPGLGNLTALHFLDLSSNQLK